VRVGAPSLRARRKPDLFGNTLTATAFVRYVRRRTDQGPVGAFHCAMNPRPARQKKENQARAAPAAAPQNRLLSALPPAQSTRLMARCTPVDLTFGDVLYGQGDRV
jgi:hypothetical protein